MLQARLYSTKKTTKIKTNNHYDTLKITPHATQNEIKKAYYKLTLQYHPDKNKSDVAKEKFQDISEAYEVLSNHELRKNYDRRMMIRQPISTATIREPTVHYKEQVYSGSSKIYNFDEWTKAHYGMEFQKSQKRRNAYKNLKKMEKLEKEQQSNSSSATSIAIVILSLTLFAMYFRDSFDKPVSKKNNRHIEQSGEDNKD